MISYKLACNLTLQTDVFIPKSFPLCLCHRSIVYSENLPNPQSWEYNLAGLGRFSEDLELWEASLCHQRALSLSDVLTLIVLLIIGLLAQNSIVGLLRITAESTYDHFENLHCAVECQGELV